jgi:hypothetical protein
LLGREAGIFSKNITKIVRVIVTALIGYLKGFQTRGPQQLFGPVYSDPGQVLFESLTRFVTEHRAKMAGAKIDLGRNIIQ